MQVQNQEPYTLLKGRRILYDYPNHRMPHNGQQECTRRIKQAMQIAIKQKNRAEMYRQIALYAKV